MDRSLGIYSTRFLHLLALLEALGFSAACRRVSRDYRKARKNLLQTDWYEGEAYFACADRIFTYLHTFEATFGIDGSSTFDGANQTLTTVPRSGEPYTFGFDPPRLPEYLAARDLALIEDVGADEYRARYLVPLGRGEEPLSEFQRALLVRVGGIGRSASASAGT